MDGWMPLIIPSIIDRHFLCRQITTNIFYVKTEPWIPNIEMLNLNASGMWKHYSPNIWASLVKNQALSQIHQDQFNHIVSNTRWESRAWNLTQGFRMMASTWSLALWLTATDHHSTGPGVFTPLSAAGAAESRGAMQSTGPYRDKQRSRMRAPHQRHVPHSSITPSSRVHWLHCFRNCRMDSNRGVDFIVLPAGKSGDGKTDSCNPQAWGLKRGNAALFRVRIDFTCLYLANRNSLIQSEWDGRKQYCNKWIHIDIFCAYTCEKEAFNYFKLHLVVYL